MQVDIYDDVLDFAGDRVRYNQRYVTIGTLRALVPGWLQRLNTVGRAGEEAFLPFNIDDEYVEALSARFEGDTVALVRCRFDAIGYDHGEDEPVEYMIRSTDGKLPVERCSHPIGRYPVAELVEALGILCPS